MSLRQIRAHAVLERYESSLSLACYIRLTGGARFATRIAFSIMLPLLFGMDRQSAVAGTSGTWTDTVSGGLWSDSLNWLNSVVADGVDSSADFSALDITSDLSIGLDSARTIGNLYFGDMWPSNNWTLGNNGNSANVLTMAVSGGAPTIAVVNQATSISAVLSGTSGFTKTGVGSLALSATAANTFSGVTTIDAGIVDLRAPNPFGTSSVVVHAGGEILSHGTTVSVPVTISGTGVDGAGAINSVGPNSDTYSGHISVTGGGATISASPNPPFSSGPQITITGGIDTGNGNVLTFAGGSNITVNTAPIIGSGSLRYRGVPAFAPSTGFFFQDASTLALTTANSYSGGTTIDGGIVFINSPAALGTGPVVINNTGELDIQNGGSFANPLTIAGSGVTYTGLGGAIGGTNSAAATLSGPIILSGDAALGSNLILTNSINTNGHTLSIPKDVTAGGGITGTGGVLVPTHGFFIISAATDYTGGTTLIGNLRANNANGSATGTGPVLIMPGGRLYGSGKITGPVSTFSVGIGGGSNAHLDTLFGATHFAGGLDLDDHAIIDIRNTTPTFAVTGDLSLGQGGTVNITDVSLPPGTYKLFTYTGTLTDGSGWTMGTTTNQAYNSTFTFSAAVPGEFDLIIGTGTSNRRTFSGKGGNSNWTTAGNWQTGVAPVPGNEIVFDGQSPFGFFNNDFPANTPFKGMRFYNNINTLAMAGNAINLGGDIISDFGHVRLDMSFALQQSTNLVGGALFNGVLSGPYAVTVASSTGGSNIINLTATNTFSGGLSVVNGTLEVPFVNSGNAAGPLGINNSVSLGAAFNQIGTLLVDNSSTSNMPFTLVAGGTGNFSMGPTTTSTTVTLTGPIIGGGALMKSGFGTLILAAANSYSGGTSISAGLLQVVNQNGSATGTGPILVGPGASLSGSTSPGQGTVNGTVTLAPTTYNMGSVGGGLVAFGGALLTINGGLVLQDGSRSTFTLGSPTGTTNPMISVTGGIQATGTHVMSFLSASPPQLGTYELIAYTGASPSLSNFAVGSFPSGFSFTLSNGPSQIDLIVSGPPLSWTGANRGTGPTNGSWDTSSVSSNWSVGAMATSYQDGAAVTFGNTNAISHANVNTSVITVQATGVAPASVVFNSTSSIGYTVGNASGGIGITGPTGLVIQAGGTVTFKSQNTYSGGTTISNGCAVVGTSSIGAISSGPLGTGLVTLGASSGSSSASIRFGTANGLLLGNAIALQSGNSGTMAIGGTNSSGANTFSGDITLGSGVNSGKSLMVLSSPGGEIDVTGRLLANGNDTSAGVTFSGGGLVKLTAAETYGGPTSIVAGTLRLLTAGSNNLSQSRSIDVGNGAMLDVSEVLGTGGFALDGGIGQTLMGKGKILGNMTITAGSHLAPGESVGTLTASGLTLAFGAILDMEFDATPANDFVKVTGVDGLTINGGCFNLLQEGTNSPFSALGTYHLLSYVGTLQGPGISSLSVLDPQPGRSYSFTNNTRLHDIDLTIGVPEPSSLILLAFGGLAIAAAAIRRRLGRQCVES